MVRYNTLKTTIVFSVSINRVYSEGKYIQLISAMIDSILLSFRYAIIVVNGKLKFLTLIQLK